MTTIIVPASSGGISTPPSSWEHIAAIVLTEPAASISFAAIDPSFRMFRLTLFLVKDANAGQAELRLNNDSGANYDQQYMNFNNNAKLGGRNAGLDSLRINNYDNIGAGGLLVADILIAKQLAATHARIQSYASYAGGSVNPLIDLVTAEWNNAADLISRIDIVESGANGFAAGSRAVLEGIQLST